MSANLSTQPASRAYAGDPIWCKVETDLITGVAAYFEITITTGGPSATETLLLTWPGGSVTYEVGSADGSLNWPEQGPATLADYTATVAEFLRLREDVGAVFDVSIEDAAGGVIRLTAKAIEAFAISATDGFTNVAVSANNGTAASTEDNLRAYVEVWTDTGDFNTARRILAMHSPYDVTTSETDLDISAAFAHLKAHLPDPATINPAVAPSSLPWTQATDAIQKYTLRVADKYGAPAVAEGLFPWGPYTAVHGSRSTEAFSASTIRLLHNYRRRDGSDFRKPVGEYQPDWVYYASQTGEAVYVTLTVYWSDGTESVYNPWNTTTVSMIDGYRIWWSVAGFRQLKLHNLAPSGSTDPEAYIIGYDWKLKGASATPLATARYDVRCDSPWEHYLLYDNGLGGMETVWLRGKMQEGYAPAGEEFQRPRRPGHSAQVGDFDIYNATGRSTWTMNTGWFSEDFYVEHLRQLPLAKAWLVDRVNRRFLKVIVESKQLEDIHRDDETLYSLSFTLRSGWIDSAANI